MTHFRNHHWSHAWWKFTLLLTMQFGYRLDKILDLCGVIIIGLTVLAICNTRSSSSRSSSRSCTRIGCRRRIRRWHDALGMAGTEPIHCGLHEFLRWNGDRIRYKCKHAFHDCSIPRHRCAFQQTNVLPFCWHHVGLLQDALPDLQGRYYRFHFAKCQQQRGVHAQFHLALLEVFGFVQETHGLRYVVGFRCQLDECRVARFCERQVQFLHSGLEDECKFEALFELHWLDCLFCYCGWPILHLHLLLLLLMLWLLLIRLLGLVDRCSGRSDVHRPFHTVAKIQQRIK
mmetsp:Transcript_22249/g.63083  ORF Transcript_22249/g.63083 Transcript_22249/m.63083 type:complete len:287 (-) Transcript_22249:1363-2223(-)